MLDTTESTATRTTAVHPEFERGATAAAESIRLYFCDENGSSIYPDLSTEVLEQNEGYAVADALRDEKLRLERQSADSVTVVPAEYRVLPSAYDPIDEDGLHFELRVVWRGFDSETGTDRWAVIDSAGHCLAADGTWEHEPRPSSREDGWLARFRFSREQALVLAQQHVDQIEINGRTLLQWQQLRAESGSRA